jgi:hypothetical protein
MNKLKKLTIDIEIKYLQMSLLYNYFHEAKLLLINALMDGIEQQFNFRSTILRDIFRF